MTQEFKITKQSLIESFNQLSSESFSEKEKDIFGNFSQRNNVDEKLIFDLLNLIKSHSQKEFLKNLLSYLKENHLETIKKTFKNKLMKGWARDKLQTFKMLNMIFSLDAQLSKDIYHHLSSQPGFYDLSMNGLIHSAVTSLFSLNVNSDEVPEETIYSYMFAQDQNFAYKTLKFLALRGLKSEQIDPFKKAIQTGTLNRKGVMQYQGSLQLSWYQWLFPWNWVKFWRYSNLSKIVSIALEENKGLFIPGPQGKSFSTSTYFKVSSMPQSSLVPKNLPKPEDIDEDCDISKLSEQSIPTPSNAINDSIIPSTPTEVTTPNNTTMSYSGTLKTPQDVFNSSVEISHTTELNTSQLQAEEKKQQPTITSIQYKINNQGNIERGEFIGNLSEKTFNQIKKTAQNREKAAILEGSTRVEEINDSDKIEVLDTWPRRN